MYSIGGGMHFRIFNWTTKHGIWDILEEKKMPVYDKFKFLIIQLIIFSEKRKIVEFNVSLSGPKKSRKNFKKNLYFLA